MAKLRRTVQREVKDLLDSSIFTSDDFECTFGDHEKKEYIIVVTFKHDESYSYDVAQTKDSLHQIRYYVTRSPGEIEEKQTYIYANLLDAMSAILEWCHEIRNELKAIQPEYEEIESLKESIFQQIKGSDDTNGEFSVTEINKLRKNFHDLEQRVSELENEKVITETQLEEFKVGIKQVSEDLEFYPKSTWVKTATNKIGKLVVSIGKSKEGRAIIAEGAKKLLGL